MHLGHQELTCAQNISSMSDYGPEQRLCALHVRAAVRGTRNEGAERHVHVLRQVITLECKILHQQGRNHSWPEREERRPRLLLCCSVVWKAC